MNKPKLICRLCGYKVVPSRRKDFEETGVLFRHQLRDKSEECDMEGDHEAEAQVLLPADLDGGSKVWSLSFVKEGEESPLIEHRRK